MRDDSQQFQPTLLLYLAGELPAGEAAELEKRIASDPALTQSLEELRHLNEGLTLLLHQSDSIAIPAVRESRRSASVRQISRAMVRRRLQESEKEVDIAAQPQVWRLRNWSMPIAAAIAIVALGIFYLSRNIKLPPDPTITAFVGPSSQPTVQDGGPTFLTEPAATAPSADLAYSNDTEAEDASDDPGRDLLKVSDGDKSFLAIAPSGYDVSSMFDSQTE